MRKAFRIEVTCPNCEKIFELAPWEYRTRMKAATFKLIYCSLKCSHVHYKKRIAGEL